MASGKGNGMRVVDPSQFDINDPTLAPDTSNLSGLSLEHLGQQYQQRRVQARHQGLRQRYDAGEFGFDPVTAYELHKAPDPRELQGDAWGSYFGVMGANADAAGAQGKSFSTQGEFDQFSPTLGSQAALQGLARKRR